MKLSLWIHRSAAAHPDKVSGRIVTLGTPHCGSMAAERVRSMGLGTPLLGGSYRYALDGAAPACRVRRAPASSCRMAAVSGLVGGY